MARRVKPTQRLQPRDVAQAGDGLQLILQAIADQLNGEGVPTAHGGARWWPSTVGKVLQPAGRAQPLTSGRWGM